LTVFENILAATDFGAPAEAALLCACELACAYAAILHLVHVVPGRTRLSAPGPAIGGYVSDAPARQQLQDLLTHVVQGYRLPAKPRTVILRSSAPASAILDYAKSQPIDMIVLGTHGVGGMDDFVMGSVAQKIVRSARCPVLTVRSGGSIGTLLDN
jgi:nucleotide-binding universal stress UspA family protein